MVLVYLLGASEIGSFSCERQWSSVVFPPHHPRPPSLLRWLVILEAQVGSQEVLLKTSPTLLVTPDSQEGPLSGTKRCYGFTFVLSL